jgi:rhodanese-related sulfurtransferase
MWFARWRRSLVAIDTIGQRATEGVKPMLTKTTAHLIAEAKGRIETLAPAAVAAELDGGDVLLVDLREAEELAQHGSIPGAIHTPRGMLEFSADPTSAYHRPEFDPGRRTILFCASGGRSALAADVLRLLGYTRVAHLDGGLTAWREAGLTVERQERAGRQTSEGGHAMGS